MVQGDTIITSCPACKAQYRVASKSAGRQIACRECGQSFAITGEKTGIVNQFIGKLAVMYRFITDEQLNMARMLAEEVIKAGKFMPLDKIMLKKSWITPQQRQLLQNAGHYCNERKKDAQFGALAMAEGLVNKEQLDQALKKQADQFANTQCCRLVGDILVEQGVLAAAQRDTILKEQQRLIYDLTQVDDILTVADPGPESPPAAGAAEAPRPEEQANSGTMDGVVSQNRMQAFLRIQPPFSITVEEVKTFLMEKGVQYGLIPDVAIANILKSQADEVKSFLIAQGDDPVPGQDASVKFHFDTDYLKAGRIAVEGKIDYKDRGAIPHVAVGDLLAEKIPMQPGKPGRDVFGADLLTNQGQDRDPLCGEGARYDAATGQVTAAIEGQPMATLGGKISVLSELKIPGNVDLSTGHIEFEGNVIVSGIVESGFRVNCGNLTATEIMEAEITAKGDVTVKGGIIGARINAGGNVSAKYINISDVKAMGDIRVDKEILESQVNASGACDVSRGKIIASKISAHKGVVAKDIGTDVSKPCHIYAGVAHHIEMETDGMRKAIERRKEALVKLQAQDKQLEAEGIEHHKRIADAAQLQDRSMIAQREVKKKIGELKAKGDLKAMADMERELLELDRKAKTAEDALDGLFTIQDQLDQRGEILQAEIVSVMDEINELEIEYRAMIDWAKNEKPVPVVVIKGHIMDKTRITGVHSTIYLDQPQRFIQVREIKNTDPEAKREYEMKVMPATA